MPRKTKFSIYIGNESATVENIVSRNLQEKIADGRVAPIPPTEDSIEGAIAYWIQSEEKSPKWHSTIREVFQTPAFSSSSAAALIIIPIDERLVVVTYSYGSKLLNDRFIEHDFGIKVAANAIFEEEVSSLQKSNVANAMKQFAQSPTKASFGTFGGQGKFEIIRRLSGACEEDDIDTLTGTTGVSFTTDKTIREIIPLARRLVALYNSNRYQNTAFSVIDDFKPVLNPSEIEDLDTQLINEINTEDNELELSVPQLRFDDVGYVKFSGVGHRQEYADASLTVYKSTFESTDIIELEDLTADKITFYTDDHTFNGSWAVKKCLVGYVTLGSQRFVINEGKYYRPSITLFSTINNYFSDRKKDTDHTLDTFQIKSWKKEYGRARQDGSKSEKDVPVFEREEDYNSRIGQNSTYINFDQKWHSSSTGEFNKLEVCDLYDPDHLRFIHVKRTSRQPAMVSYLFDQGLKGASLWGQEDVKSHFVEIVRTQAGDDAAARLANANANEITIEFAIADYRNSDNEFTIPFLAKLSFETKIREIENRGFSTAVSFIPIAEPVLVSG